MKSFLQSKTLWLNVLAIAAYYANINVHPVILAIANFILRLITTKALIWR